MQRIHLVAWSAAEAQDRGHLLKRAGFSVETTRLSPQVLRGIKRLPDAFVFDLSRAPSLGRDLALFIRQLAMTRRVPLVFVGGDPTKVAGVREVLPDASYINDWSGAVSAVKRAIAHPPQTPLVPGVFAPFAGVPLAQKLGIKPNTSVALINAPDGFERTLGSLPPRATVRRGVRDDTNITLWFVRSRAEVDANIDRMKPRAAGGGLWILWPKKTGKADINQIVVRRIGLAHGLVDFKIASVNATWSGLRFTLRKAR